MVHKTLSEREGTQSVAKARRSVKFYEVRNAAGERVKAFDWDVQINDVIAGLAPTAKHHWDNGIGLRVRGRRYLPAEGTSDRVPLVILDHVFREPNFTYVKDGLYSEHTWSDDREFAEPKFLALFSNNVLATFTSGIRIPSVAAALNSWRATSGLEPLTIFAVTDLDRLKQLANARVVQRLKVRLPANIARLVYADRTGSIATFFRNRSQREGMVEIELKVNAADQAASSELRDELAFLLETEDTYTSIIGSPDSEVSATYLAEEGTRSHSHDFLGEKLGVTVQVDIDEPEKGPQPASASVGLAMAYRKKREMIDRVVPPV